MAGKAETARGGQSRSAHCGAALRQAGAQPAWRLWLAPAVLVFLAGSVLAALSIAPAVLGSAAWSAVLAPIGLAALVAAAFAALRVGAGSSTGIDRLGRAGDAAAAAPLSDGSNDAGFAGEQPAPAPRPAREPFQRLFANAPVGIAVVDRLGRFVEANRAAGELLGVSPEQLSGAELTGFLAEAERAAIAARLAAAADGAVDPEPIEIRLDCPRERTLVLLLSRFDDEEDDQERKGPALPTGARNAAEPGPVAIAARSDADPDGGSLMLHLIDVTEQKNLEAQFAQSQKMQAVGQLAGGVAHDFNNLLTAMIGFCDLLLLRFRPGDPSFADIMQIKQNANRAANLVRQLLAFSRQQTLQPRILDITDVLVELSHLLRRLIGENIELEGRARPRSRPRQGRSGPARAGHHQSRGQCARRDAGRRHADDPHRQRHPARADCAAAHEVMPAGDYVLIEVADTGVGIRQGQSRAHLRAVLLDQGGRLRHRARPVDGLRHRQADRRLRLCRQRAGQGRAFQIYLPRHRAADAAAASPRRSRRAGRRPRT